MRVHGQLAHPIRYAGDAPQQARCAAT